jgi:hypothetical protein
LIPYFHGKIAVEQLFALIKKEEEARRLELWNEIVESPPKQLKHTLQRIANDLAS